MTFREKRNLSFVLIGILLILVLIPIIGFRKKQPLGEYITTKEVQVLTELTAMVVGAYDEVYEQEEFASEQIIEQDVEKQTLVEQEVIELQQDNRIEATKELKKLTDSWEQGDLTYEQFHTWYTKAEELNPVMTEQEKKKLKKKYKDTFFFLKEDWYVYFDKLCQKMDSKGEIQKQELILLGDTNNVIDIEGNPIEENLLFSDNGLWKKKLPFIESVMQKKAQYVTYQDTIWGVIRTEEEAGLKNIWIVENAEGKLSYFYNNHEVVTVKEEIEHEGKEQIADISFQQGKLSKITPKTERVSGELLKMSAQEVEIKGVGTFPLSEDVRYYRLYDRLESLGRSQMRIGYNFADFVIEDGVIQAGLLVKDEKMEYIRVLIKNSDYAGYYHEEVECVSDVDMELIYGENVLSIPAGETFRLDKNSEYFSTSRIYLKPAALTGRTVFTSVKRNQSGQGYRGSFELEKREDGIVVINQVLLEEYLYAVVPSEMPGYYPMEALKAQAVSARTYAYDKMESSSLGSWGAHLDDSSTFQVYNNIQENANTTKAVKETRGQLLYSPSGLAETYYYSTSCGFGTNANIWSSEGAVKFPYLQAKEMTVEANQYTSDELKKEEIFRSYMDNKIPSHFEAEEGWYRWEYTHSDMNRIVENLKIRQEKDSSNILFSTDGESFDSVPLDFDMEIQDIQVRSRGDGGTVEELLIFTNKGQVLVRKEMNVRSVLTNGEAKVVLQNEKTYSCKNLLPSAFFYVMTEKEGDKVTSFQLKGGGFGHGVGMSQNGAKNLANLGKSAEEILTFYYEGCNVQRIYD